ncbi:aminopeptidase N [Acinetobacter haemolyticus]|uniref:Aminopeptidase N n=1 Tax=Acinetobacter haemolyticus CIP 64.3 = MTCC 9819 TaxID=1217659 RepID=N9GJM1_ACIHA|nr:aminopeptidase N [Acinetobacter haemolyticus]ENW17334.1 aminopeptidase N [Acinetobacter haemolyticus CIP 64.3 = MTCC 9819]EPR89952.1 Membrane alanine aminopeptidase N [Acinetobacter haemolyticus CIP 64.3 = MTCC 9819]NAR97756.1 aminopeptidase N [Acinetobacter haemolyticus]QXZ26299.1 aminopeptidase N [Acinetobacter haemolyticus]WHR57705.1 aminopeptidase N [Acinetobacter haemolyticus]
MNIAAQPPVQTDQTIYLKDYQKPSFLVDSIHLDIQVYENHTIVDSTLVMKRQSAGSLILLGRDLELKSIQLNGQTLNSDQYELDSEQLVITDAPDEIILQIQVIIHPESNTQLEGLYKAGDLYVTQNEPEGFRKITFYPDRPDVLSVFTTRVEADKKYPVLLANGNLLETGEVDENRHFAIWQDPTKKPSYLFACVIGDLAVLKDRYTTSEGRDVALEIYAVEKDIPKCHIAMEALKHSMRWDEEHYGRPYDLDNYMIVAVSQFNMGAMENKGLNIFNTSCVLADEEYTTDAAIMRVQSVIAHEYFHNWTGNRITCRDWFQLCLKEGLTVFRDQSFSEDLQSAAVQRIDDVAVLKSHQFPEDAGPLSHPPRPDHFVEINNFYTATVYEKGAEINRMMATLLGKDKYRQGTDEYFKRHDGQAVTVEDWVAALSAGSGVDLSNFLTWYNQPGTPKLEVNGAYDATAQTYRLSFKQSLKAHPKYPNLKAVPIPIALALFNAKSGEQYTLHSADLFVNDVKDGMYLFEQDEATIEFTGITEQPVVSLLRNFSAPVNLAFDYSNDDLAFLIQHETNGFNQWQATQTLLERILLEDHKADTYIDAIKNTLPDLVNKDPLLASRLFDVPSENYLGSRIDQDYEPELIREKREAVLDRLARELGSFWKETYLSLDPDMQKEFSLAMGVRALKNIMLSMLARQGDDSVFDLAYAQYQQTGNMSERLGALRVLVWNDAPQAQLALDDFYNRFKDEALSLDQWFTIQASHPCATAETIEYLTKHADYDLGTPNRIRSVSGGLASNPVNTWSFGVDHFIELAAYLDEKNPILGSRLLQVLSRWYTLMEPQRSQVQQALKALQPKVKSKNVSETLNSLLSI